MKVSLICDETVHSITDFRQHIRQEFYHKLTFVYQYHYISKIKQNSANFVFLSTGYQHHFCFFCINYHAILPTPVLKGVKCQLKISFKLANVILEVVENGIICI